MRLAGNRKVRQKIDGEGSGEKGLTAFTFNSPILTIPRFDTNIRTVFEDTQYTQNLATLALNLMRCGYIKDSDSTNLQQLIRNGFQQWIHDTVGELNFYNFSFETTPDIGYFESMLVDYGEFDIELIQKITGKHPMYCVLNPDKVKLIAVGKALSTLEENIPGLGATAYYWLVTLGSFVLDMHSPWRAEDYAIHTWWFGEDNDEDYLEMLKEYYEGDAEENVGITPSQWKASFPDWVTAIKNPLSEKELQALVNLNDNSLESRVAEALLPMIANERVQIPTVHQYGVDTVESAIYIVWEDGDHSIAVADDRINDINMNGGDGYADILSLIPIPNKPVLFRKWLVDMERGFRQLKNIERLIELIGVQL